MQQIIISPSEHKMKSPYLGIIFMYRLNPYVDPSEPPGAEMLQHSQHKIGAHSLMCRISIDINVILRVMWCVTRPFNPSSTQLAAATNKGAAAACIRGMQATLARESLTLTAFTMDIIGA